MQPEIVEKVNAIISTHLSFTADKINVTDRLVDDLGADSLDHIEIVMEVEEEFSIEIPDAEVDKLHTVNDVFRVVEKLLGEKPKAVNS